MAMGIFIGFLAIGMALGVATFALGGLALAIVGLGLVGTASAAVLSIVQRRSL